ncbi:MAG: Rieske 2Fe-2S domain-containing protein, partial [Chloroflexi bacterium]|nr:Rieske 2Fe-2S domain-containing protein [Chloroflexota bacterium]
MSRPALSELMQADRAHRLVYTDPDVFELEMERIFRSNWLYIGHESEVPAAGDFKTETIARQPLIMTRDEGGQVHVLYNRCRHRGTVIRREQQGNSAVLTCPFHGWTYAPDGRLMNVPSGESFGFGSTLDQCDFGLVPVGRVDSCCGFVFASLSEDVPSLAEHLGRATHYLEVLTSRAPSGRIQARRPIRSEYAGNWKHFFDQEAFHAPILHASTFAVGNTQKAGKYGEQYSWDLVKEVRYNDRSIGRGHGVNDFGGIRQRDYQDLYKHPGFIAALEPKFGHERAAELAALD